MTTRDQHGFRVRGSTKIHKCIKHAATTAKRLARKEGKNKFILAPDGSVLRRVRWDRQLT